MGAIKDVADLVNQLLQKTEDRKFTGELREIQKMIVSIQSEQARLQEQNMAVMKENADVKRENADVKRENADVKQENTQLKQKIVALEQHGQRRDSLEQDHLGEPETRILKLLASKQRIDAPAVAGALGISEPRAEHYLHKLEQAGFLSSPLSSLSIDQGNYYEYTFTPKGREYLVLNNLIE